MNELTYTIIKKSYFEKRIRKSADYAVRNSFKSFQLNERDQCALNEFCENQNENKHENEQNKKIL